MRREKETDLSICGSRSFRGGKERAPEIDFFSCPITWQRRIAELYPSAKVHVDIAGVSRAFVGRRKVAVFGKLPNHGFISSVDIAKKMAACKRTGSARIVRKDKDPEASRARRSASMKAAWARRKAERRAANVRRPKVVRLQPRATL